MKPIAVKSLGINKTTGLEEQLHVWQLTIDAKSEVVVVVFDIVTLAPNGEIVKVSETNSYRRYNYLGEPATEDKKEIPANMKFDEYRNSQIGQAISGMIQKTIELYPDLEQKNN
jgi:hypothetical protein